MSTPVATADDGLGLVLVQRLSNRWGVVRDSLTEVWFEIDL